MNLKMNVYEHDILCRKEIIKLELKEYEYHKLNMNSKKTNIFLNRIFQSLRLLNGMLVFLEYHNINGITYFIMSFDFYYILFSILSDFLIFNGLFNGEDNFDNYFIKYKGVLLSIFIFIIFYELFYLIIGLYLIYFKFKNILIYKILFLNCIIKLMSSIVNVFFPHLNILKPIKELSINFNILKLEYIKEKNISKDDCGICLNKMNNRIIKLNNCDHYFHINCIIKWFKLRKTTCPMCRESILDLK
jgi:hypothetical protein